MLRSTDDSYRSSFVQALQRVHPTGQSVSCEPHVATAPSNSAPSRQILTAADPIPEDLPEALAQIGNSGTLGLS